MGLGMTGGEVYTTVLRIIRALERQPALLANAKLED